MYQEVDDRKLDLKTGSKLFVFVTIQGGGCSLMSDCPRELVGKLGVDTIVFANCRYCPAAVMTRTHKQKKAMKYAEEQCC